MFSARRNTLALAAAGLLAIGGMAGTAQAEQGLATGDIQNQQPQAQTEANEFSTQKLDAYAEAALKIGRINAEMAPEIRAAEDEQQRKSKTLEMQQEMVNAIQDSEGITMQEYNQISLALREDPQLAEKIRTLFDEKVLKLQQDYEQQGQVQ